MHKSMVKCSIYLGNGTEKEQGSPSAPPNGNVLHCLERNLSLSGCGAEPGLSDEAGSAK